MSDGEVFAALRALVSPYSDGMIVRADVPDNYYLEEDWSGPKPQMFAAVQLKKSYVSLHIFPVYCHPELIEDGYAQMRARMQGKSCFNFKNVEQIPTEEVVALLQAAHEAVERG